VALLHVNRAPSLLIFHLVSPFMLLHRRMVDPDELNGPKEVDMTSRED